jgi:hypothetical protein
MKSMHISSSDWRPPRPARRRISDELEEQTAQQALKLDKSIAEKEELTIHQTHLRTIGSLRNRINATQPAYIHNDDLLEDMLCHSHTLIQLSSSTRKRRRE